MEMTEVTFSAFKDELEKIAGMTRIGKPPMLAGTAAAKGAIGRAKVGLGKFFKKTSASVNPRHVLPAAAAGGALALYGQHKVKKMHEDYQAGRAMRKAQGM